MNKKKLLIIIILIITALFIYLIATNISITKTDEFSDYTPEEEISEQQAKETSITLYFLDKDTNKLKSTSVLVNLNDLLKNPYSFIVNKLIAGPSDEKLQAVFPENSRLIDTNFSNGCVTLNFSDDLLKFTDDTQKFNIINSILNSLSQLNEVNSIKFLINNEPNEKLSEEYSVISEKT